MDARAGITHPRRSSDEMPTLTDTVGHRRKSWCLSNETVDLLVKVLKMWEAVFCLCEERLPLERGVCCGVEGAQSGKCTG